THGQIRRVIREQHLTSITQVMQFLEWRSMDGCATCRPALNYYLLSTWPGEAMDDAKSRLANERMHANIQKDGTYSVVPRMWGGGAHVGGCHPRERAAAHRRRRRQIQHSDGEGHRWPAQRSAGREKGGPAPGLGRSRHALRSRLWQEPAHGQDLRGQRILPFW